MKKDNKKIINQKEHRINHEIKARYVFLINENGDKLGNTSIFEARDEAAKVGKDLVQISIQNNLSICKIMDYGKFCFENKKNKAKNKKSNKTNEIKEIQVRPLIEENDFQVKLKRISDFLDEGYKINIVLKFKGRQITHPEVGLKVLNKFLEILDDKAKLELAPKIEGKRALMTLSPKAKTAV